MSSELPPEIVKALPGTLGAIVALRWVLVLLLMAGAVAAGLVR